MTEIMSVNRLLEMNLDIPNYQRPYKWDIQNMDDLNDISNAIADADWYRTEFKYRIGTITCLSNDKPQDGFFSRDAV